MLKINSKQLAIVIFLIIGIVLVIFNILSPRDWFSPKSQSDNNIKASLTEQTVNFSDPSISIHIPAGFTASKNEQIKTEDYTSQNILISNSDINLDLTFVTRSTKFANGISTGGNETGLVDILNTNNQEIYIQVNNRIARWKNMTKLRFIEYFYIEKNGEDLLLYQRFPDILPSAHIQSGMSAQVYFKNRNLSKEKEQEYLQITDKVVQSIQRIN